MREKFLLPMHFRFAIFYAPTMKLLSTPLFPNRLFLSQMVFSWKVVLLSEHANWEWGIDGHVLWIQRICKNWNWKQLKVFLFIKSFIKTFIALKLYFFADNPDAQVAWFAFQDLFCLSTNDRELSEARRIDNEERMENLQGHKRVSFLLHHQRSKIDRMDWTWLPLFVYFQRFESTQVSNSSFSSPKFAKSFACNLQ